MAAITWSEALALQQPQMDHTHQEFVDLLAELEAVQDAEPEVLLACYDRFVAHTVDHFGQEDRWMATIGFEPGNCHTSQHAQVLELLHAVRGKMVSEGNTALVAQLVPALAEWFVPHAQNMDGGLAQVIRLTGFDPATGTMTNPPQPASAVTSDAAFEPAAATTAGCGSHGCS